ncbi:glutathione peroxidase [Christensenella tenuis]|uniref:Glutathione peroxidase n=1 Tax=Christensenella tenuis TaxID=2763033 RepID=A0ABR7EAZ4_9FIRM|nr:glutathione peroxidase [Christensenella tenuis]MBC5646965.1 glutathione peroxidase [Christensenella tenuis]
MNVYDFDVKKMNGETQKIRDYEGNVLLIVNTASKCGFTPQFEGLEKLYQTYGEKGLAIIGFPCNQFAGQDPGTNEEIKEFCSLNYGVTFPMMAKIDVNGKDAEPLYEYLKSQKGFAGFDMEHPIAGKLDEILRAENKNYDETSDIKWNFTKFLIDRKGTVVERFEPTATPDKIAPAIEKLL